MMRSSMGAVGTHERKRRALTLMELTIVIFLLAITAGLIISNLDFATELQANTATQASLIEVRDAFTRYWMDNKHTQLLRADLNLVASMPSPANRRQAVAILQSWFNVTVLISNPGIFANQYSPETRIGWNGPYVSNQPVPYQVPEDTLELDGGSQSNIGGFLFLDQFLEISPTLVDTDDYATEVDPFGQPTSFSLRDSYGRDWRMGRPIIIQPYPVYDIENRLVQIDVRVVSAGADGRLETPRFRSNQELIGADVGDDIYVAFEVRP